MEMTVSGPMFEGAESGPWRSTFGKPGAHYNSYYCKGEDGMAALREFLSPDGDRVNEMNFVLFSTSGVHGSYSTIEDAEREILTGKNEDGEPVRYPTTVTFLIVQPRICCLRYGNCQPRNAEDIAYLKVLREKSSWAVVSTIGREGE